MSRRTTLALLAALAPTLARAQEPRAATAAASPCVSLRAADHAGRWPAPLDRVVSLETGPTSLGTALEQVASAARLRLSYSPELLPLDRQLCVRVDRVAAGDVLLALLAGVAVSPVLAGADQVVLAPSTSAAASDAVPTLARSTGRLARVVVTGTATGGAERASPFALTVLEGRALASDGAMSLSQALNSAVPGLWLWTQSPTSVLARYGSVRGASSFGVSTPKIYVDGIEVANPLVVTQLDPARVERVEVIRGPQGAALYGADAISGVVQIVTRHEGAGGDAPAADVRVSAGASASDYAGGVLTQEHGVTLRAGTAARSLTLGATASTLGAFVPGAGARQLLLTGSARRVGSRVVLASTMRLQATNADVPASPLLRGVTTVPATALDSAARERVRQYTMGTSATFHATDAWTHALVVGVDGYRLAGVSDAGMLLPSATDSALRAARGGADRLTVRLSGTRRTGEPERHGFSLTLGVEHSTAREDTNGQGTQLVTRRRMAADSTVPMPAVPSTLWWRSTGVLVQGRAALANNLFVSGGVRLEHIVGPDASAQVAVLPMLGGAWVLERGDWTIKARSAYGRGIRPARTVARGGTWSGGHVGTPPWLDPEEQSGVELGLDALWGSRAAVRVTRFDQQARGLVQPVAVLVRTRGGGGPGPSGGETHVWYELQNVGAIDNRGWELQATTAAGPLDLGVTATLVQSRVARLATGYRGDLRAGDRLLEVPARTLGMTATWHRARWSATGTLTRAFDWVNYDRLAIARAVAADTSGRAPVGPELRDYWRSFPGVTHANVRALFAISPRASVTVAGDNLLDRQIGEPDDVTVLPGRTVSIGVRTALF